MFDLFLFIGIMFFIGGFYILYQIIE